MISAHQFIISLVLTSTLANEEAAITARAVSDRFVTLSADCSKWLDNQTIYVSLHTSEPFFGSLYSRDHASTCKSVGKGSTTTRLVISPEVTCGIETAEPRAGKVVQSSSDQVSMLSHAF